MSASHVLLTGQPGVGKTTIIRKVCEELKKQHLKVDGFYTEEVRVGRERIGFDIVTLSGKRDVLARVSDGGTARGLPKVGKYSVHVASFEKLALPVFECSGLDVLVLDEIGKMELFSRAFLSRARGAFQERSARRILATIPVPKGPMPLVDDLRHRDDCTLIQFIMLYIPSWIFIILMSSKLCDCTLSDLGHHLFHTANVSSDQLPAWVPDASGSEHSHQYNIQTQNGYPPEAESFLASYYAGMRHVSPLQDAQQRKVFAYLDRRPDYRTSAYQDHQVAHSEVEYDVAPLRKHDFTDQGYGQGWDMFSGGPGQGSGGLSGGLAQVGGLALVKKGKGAKALFALMAPLILLAVFGPILATQAMIPWVANGGLNTVTAVAQGRRRRKRSHPNPELEKRLRLFLEVQDFIARSGSSAHLAEQMGEAFLRCQKFTERRSKCLERVACEYSDETSPMDPAERRLAKMVLQNIASNSMIPTTIKGRLSKGSAFGRHNRGRCKNYWCEAIDGSRGKPRT